jgi:hypothetical protein
MISWDRKKCIQSMLQFLDCSEIEYFSFYTEEGEEYVVKLDKSKLKERNAEVIPLFTKKDLTRSS